MIARRFTSPLFVAAILFAAPVALAAPTEGEKLFREGRAAMQANDLETACARFSESQKKEPLPGTSLNLGECEERRGHLIAARDAFTTAAAGYTTADKKGYATTRAESLDKRIPRVLVKVTGTKNATVKVGERAVEVGAEMRMDPGEVVFTAEASGSKPRRMPVTLKEGGERVEIELGPLETEAAVVADKPKKEQPLVVSSNNGDTMRTVGFVVAGVGAASLVVGGITGVMALGRASTVKDHCDGDLACDGDGTSAGRQGRDLSLVSTITIIAGAVGVGAGVALILTHPAQKTGMTFAPGPGDVGLALRRTF